mgnify:CR=1 FL=1
MTPKVATMNSFLDDTKSLGQWKDSPVDDTNYGLWDPTAGSHRNYQLFVKLGELARGTNGRKGEKLSYFLHSLADDSENTFYKTVLLLISDVNFMFLACWFMLLHKCDILSELTLIITAKVAVEVEASSSSCLKSSGQKYPIFFFSENVKFSRRLSVRAQC